MVETFHHFEKQSDHTTPQKLDFLTFRVLATFIKKCHNKFDTFIFLLHNKFDSIKL